MAPVRERSVEVLLRYLHLRKSCAEQQIRRLLRIMVIVAAVLAATGTGAAAGLGSPNLAAWHAVTILRGSEVVPPPGDPDGQGAAEVRAGDGDGEACFGIEVSGVALPAVAAHVHEAPPGENGPAVLTLAAPDDDGVVSGCTTADPGVLAAIGAEPENFYVDVHTADFPDGAVRGRLEPAGLATGSNTPTIVPDAPSSGVMPETGGRGEDPRLLAYAALLLVAAGAAIRCRRCGL